MWKKVITPTLLVCGLWLALSGSTTYYMYWLSHSHARILAENVVSIRAAGTMQESLWDMQAGFMDIVHRRSDAEHVKIRQFADEFDRYLKIADVSAINESERNLVRNIRSEFSVYREYVVQHLEDSPTEERRVETLADTSTRLAQRVAVNCGALLQLNEKLMAASVTRITEVESYFGLLRLLYLIVGPAIGIVLGFRIARHVHRSISEISVTLKDASGELGQDVGSIEVMSGGDLGDLPRLNEQVLRISARIKKVVVELQAAREEAARSERLAAIGQLAAGVAHELRNPLTSVKLLIQNSVRKASHVQLDEKQSAVVLQEVSRMEDTIQGLLDFAKPSKLRRVVHDLRETVRRALNLVEGRAAHERIVVTTDFGRDEILVDADPEQLHQVFVNLFINGLESMTAGGALHIIAELSEESPRTCRVIVSDSGTGISAETLARIFEPFVTTKDRGTGLGLATSRRIIQEHDGRVIAANGPENGAVFTVELPALGSAVMEASTVPSSDADTVLPESFGIEAPSMIGGR